MKKNKRSLSKQTTRARAVVFATSTVAEPVQAAGTSEGVRKSWETRKEDGHHEYASFSREEDATKYWKRKSNEVGGTGHAKDGSGRRHIANEMDYEKDGTYTVHTHWAPVTKATDTEDVDDVVMAAGTSEGARKGWDNRHSSGWEGGGGGFANHSKGETTHDVQMFYHPETKAWLSHHTSAGTNPGKTSFIKVDGRKVLEVPKGEESTLSQHLEKVYGIKDAGVMKMSNFRATDTEDADDVVMAAWSEAARRAAAIARKHGWKKQKDEWGGTDMGPALDSTYHHPDHPGHELVIDHGGHSIRPGERDEYSPQRESAFHHFNGTKLHKKGTAKELEAHLSKFHKKSKASDTEPTTEHMNAISPTERATIHCKASGQPIAAKKTWETDKPVDFMWMPGGTHTIHASYGRSEGDQRPIELTVLVTKDSASKVQSAFEAIRAASPRRPPFICVEHQAKERAGEPVSFNWSDDPEPAIYCRCLPSALGANNVNGKIHTSFSPTFDTDAEYEKMHCTDCDRQPVACKCGEGAGWYFPTGVRGSASNPAQVVAPDVQSVGSLTNWNAFRDMRPIAARENKAVEAAGTSEGARKGWESRGGPHAAAGFAFAKSREAHEGENFHDHETAHMAHLDAADEFEKEGEHKSKRLSDFHRNEAYGHATKAAFFRSQKGGTKASSTEGTTETVKAEHVEVSVDSILKAKAPAPVVDASSILAAKKGGEQTVKAAGTSEGSKKGWQTRHTLHFDALQATIDANMNGAMAEHRSSRSHHLTSAHIHTAAAAAHKKAAEAFREDGQTGPAKEHEESAKGHKKQAAYHKGLSETASKASSTEGPVSSQTILARLGQTGPPARN